MIKWMRRFTIFFLGAVLSYGGSCSWPRHDDLFSREHLLQSPATKLSGTVVTPHLEQRLTAGKNVLWCSTFQLAWNEVMQLIGEEVHLLNEPPMVKYLNKKMGTRTDLDSASYVALAGFVKDGITDKIRSELLWKFHGKASAHLIPSTAGLRPCDIIAYGYLFKNLQFAKPFEKIDTPIVFKNKRVSCFGMSDYKPAQERMYSQVSILSYKGPDDFIIELKTKSKDDHLILAKILPEKTLSDTISRVQTRISGVQPEKIISGDQLSVPKLNFEITRSYFELYHKPLITHNPKIAKDLNILSAVQNIRFQMNGKGVILLSEVHITIGCSATTGPLAQHIMIFDKPFLILLQRTGAKYPYFALWVDNPELLVPADK